MEDSSKVKSISLNTALPTLSTEMACETSISTIAASPTQGDNCSETNSNQNESDINNVTTSPNQIESQSKDPQSGGTTVLPSHVPPSVACTTQDISLQDRIDVSAVASCSKYLQPVASTSKDTEQDTIETPNTVKEGTKLTEKTSGNAHRLDTSEILKKAECDLLVEMSGRTSDSIDPARLEIDSFHIPKVNLYTTDTGPRLYDIPEYLISKPIVPTKLSEAFSALPIFGRPKSKAELQQFQEAKIKEYVGCGLDDSEFSSLAAYCSPHNLRTGDELTMLSSPGQGFFTSEMEQLNQISKDFPDDHNLHIIKKHKLRVEKDTKNLYPKRNKYRGIRIMALGYDDEDNTPVVTLGTPITPGKELLFYIRWYRPFPYNPKDKYQLRSRHSVFSSNIVVLGRHRLSVLRERVVCPNDVDMRVDVSDNPDELPRSSAKDMFPSGFLFINNVFYVDERHGAADHSVPLRRWARAAGLGDFPRRCMQDVRMQDLDVRLGHPEVYVHQGNCEHLFTISDIRLVTASDPLRLASYPGHTALSQNQTVYCTTCAEYGAKWIVVGCPRVPFDPAFFCEKCFKLYLYKDGKKIGNFKAYLYRGNEMNVLKPQG